MAGLESRQHNAMVWVIGLPEGMESGVEDRSGVKWMRGKLSPRQRVGFADDRFPHPQGFKYTNHEGDLPPMHGR